jgi:2,3-diaminopropionate biosynthesis protein SbnA
MPLPDLSILSERQLRGMLRKIGHTPLVTVQVDGRPALLKLESRNPGGSMKDRTARFMIRRLLSSGQVRPGGEIVDSTSGNHGVSMAWVCRALGLRFVAVSDPRATPENVARMRALGAELVIVTEEDGAGGFILTRMKRARAISEQRGAPWLNQYGNPHNPLAHRLSTGPELLRQAAGRRLDAVFVPASTGGTLAGLGAYFKQASPHTRVVAVDQEGSALLGGATGRRVVNGLGSSRPSEFLRPGLYDEVAVMRGAEAFATCRALLARTGLELGGSSGAAVAAAARWLEKHPDAQVAVICPDHGANYRTTIFDDAWLEASGHAAGWAPELSC